MHAALVAVRDATSSTSFEGRLYAVGGVLRDEMLGLTARKDVDVVVDGDAAELAALLDGKGLSEHKPVVYARFGTARVQVGGTAVELTTARAEEYDPQSRKPSVRKATLRDDAFRRDFTVNTLMRNLHTGETLDLTGRGLDDIAARVLRTPLEPSVTFRDDPLRMLRAVRFAVQLGFAIEAETWRGITAQTDRIDLVSGRSRVVSAERVRDEFLKIVESPDPALGLQMLLDAGLLARFAPELAAMDGVTQNEWHHADVWQHTLLALRASDRESSLVTRLAVLFHDVGKPLTRTQDERGVHFYEHQRVGAEITTKVLARLRMPADQTRWIADLVGLHMRLGEVRPEWSEAAVRRLIRDVGGYLDDLLRVGRADMAAMGPLAAPTDLDAVEERIAAANAKLAAARVVSPLDGRQIMDALGVGPGPIVRAAKEHLVNEILEGRLAAGDSDGARRALLAWHPTGETASGG